MRLGRWRDEQPGQRSPYGDLDLSHDVAPIMSALCYLLTSIGCPDATEVQYESDGESFCWELIGGSWAELG